MPETVLRDGLYAKLTRVIEVAVGLAVRQLVCEIEGRVVGDGHADTARGLLYAAACFAQSKGTAVIAGSHPEIGTPDAPFAA